jgi:hypothetical protein
MSERKMIEAAAAIGANMDPFAISDGPRCISRLRFDGYGTHPSMYRPFALEYDGIWHFVPHYKLKRIDEFKSYLVRDRIKNDWCREHDWHILRIPYIISSDRFCQIIKEFIEQCSAADDAGEPVVQLFCEKWLYEHQNAMYPNATVNVPIHDPDDNDKTEYHKAVLRDECVDNVVEFMKLYANHNGNNTKRDRDIHEIVEYFAKIKPEYWSKLNYKTFKSQPVVDVDLINSLIETLGVGATWEFNKTVIQKNQTFLLKMAASVLEDDGLEVKTVAYQAVSGAVYRLVNKLLNAKVVNTHLVVKPGDTIIRCKDERNKLGYTTRRNRIKIPHYKIVFDTDKYGLTVLNWIHAIGLCLPALGRTS